MWCGNINKIYRAKRERARATQQRHIAMRWQSAQEASVRVCAMCAPCTPGGTKESTTVARRLRPRGLASGRGLRACWARARGREHGQPTLGHSGASLPRPFVVSDGFASTREVCRRLPRRFVARVAVPVHQVLGPGALTVSIQDRTHSEDTGILATGAT